MFYPLIRNLLVFSYIFQIHFNWSSKWFGNIIKYALLHHFKWILVRKHER